MHLGLYADVDAARERSAPNGTNLIRVMSEGYPALEIDLDSLLPRKEEKNTSAALVRGVAARVRELGYAISGFDAYITSTVLPGSGRPPPPPTRR